VALLAGLSGCVGAALVPYRRGIVVDEFPAVHVRIYRGARDGCRVEVITARETIQTAITHCVSMAHRQTPPP